MSFWSHSSAPPLFHPSFSTLSLSKLHEICVSAEPRQRASQTYKKMGIYEGENGARQSFAPKLRRGATHFDIRHTISNFPLIQIAHKCISGFLIYMPKSVQNLRLKGEGLRTEMKDWRRNGEWRRTGELRYDSTSSAQESKYAL